MKNFWEKVVIAFRWIKNYRNLLFFRDFFVFYLRRIPDAHTLPKDKSYLAAIPGLVGGFCPRHFLYYAPVFMEPFIKKIADDVFTDDRSKELYRIVFLRNMCSSHFIPGWETYYEPEDVYRKRLDDVLSAVAHDVNYNGNFFSLKKRNQKNYCLRYTNGSVYTLPINWFEISVFSFKLGLVYLDQLYLQYIRGRNIVDVGAFVGDSSIVFTEYTQKKVVAIEPGETNYALLQETIRLNRCEEKIEPFKVALDKEKRTVGIINHGAGSRIIESSGTNDLTTQTLDDVIGDVYAPVGLIKMDVEGSEMNILLGSSRLITKDRPVLLISIYHSGEQFMTIPVYMKEVYGAIYDFVFMDCNPIHPLSEKVLVCLPKKELIAGAFHARDE